MAFCLRAFGNEYMGMCIVGSERFRENVHLITAV